MDWIEELVQKIKYKILNASLRRNLIVTLFFH